MPKIVSGPVLAHILRASDRPIYVEVRAASHIFYAKAFRANLFAELDKLPENETSGLRIVEHKSGFYICPTPSFLREMMAAGFPRAYSLNGEMFANKLRETKGAVFVKVPTLAGDMKIKIAKGEFADSIGANFPTVRTGLRVYSQKTGEMLVRAF